VSPGLRAQLQSPEVINLRPSESRLGDVLEANHLGVLTEALTANVETVLADDGLLVTAHAAVAGALAHRAGCDQLLTAAPLLEVTHVVRS
jgi:hypothetical protein